MKGLGMNNTPEPTYNVAEVAVHFGCDKSGVYNLVKRGELRHIRIGKLIRIPASAVDEFLSAPSEPKAAAPAGPHYTTRLDEGGYANLAAERRGWSVEPIVDRPGWVRVTDNPKGLVYEAKIDRNEKGPYLTSVTISATRPGQEIYLTETRGIPLRTLAGVVSSCLGRIEEEERLSEELTRD